MIGQKWLLEDPLQNKPKEFDLSQKWLSGVCSTLYRQIVGIPMGTNCVPLVADLSLLCYERDFMLSPSDNNQVDVVEVFNSTLNYLDDLLITDNPYFAQMVSQIYPTVLHIS